MKTVARQSELDRTLVALADPTRRAILQCLSEGPARVTELAQPFSISLNSVSKHILLLERARLVRRRRAGRDHFLSFNRSPLDAAAVWMETHRGEWTARLQALDELLREEDRETASTRKKPRKADARKLRIKKGELR